jgi:hypothetical protein
MVRFSAVRREVEEGRLVQEAFDPHGVEGFGHIQKTAPVSRLSSTFLLTLSQHGQLQRCAVPGSGHKLLVAQQSAFVYFS